MFTIAAGCAEAPLDLQMGHATSMDHNVNPRERLRKRHIRSLGERPRTNDGLPTLRVRTQQTQRRVPARNRRNLVAANCNDDEIGAMEQEKPTGPAIQHESISGSAGPAAARSSSAVTPVATTRWTLVELEIDPSLSVILDELVQRR